MASDWGHESNGPLDVLKTQEGSMNCQQSSTSPSNNLYLGMAEKRPVPCMFNNAVQDFFHYPNLNSFFHRRLVMRKHTKRFPHTETPWRDSTALPLGMVSLHTLSEILNVITVNIVDQPGQWNAPWTNTKEWLLVSCLSIKLQEPLLVESTILGSSTRYQS